MSNMYHVVHGICGHLRQASLGHVLWMIWCLLLPMQIQTLAAVSHAVKMRVLKKAYLRQKQLPGENAAGLQNRLPIWQRDLPVSLAKTVTVLPHYVGSYSINSGKRTLRICSKKQCSINLHIISFACSDLFRYFFGGFICLHSWR